MNNAVTHRGVPLQTKAPMVYVCVMFLVFPLVQSSCSPPPLYDLLFPLLLFLLLLCVQAHKPSRPSELSPGTWLCIREPQLCWSVRCCGPRGPCSGEKTASSWDLSRVCLAFRATAWLATPREVNGHRIRSTVYRTQMDPSKLKKWTWEKQAPLKWL